MHLYLPRWVERTLIAALLALILTVFTVVAYSQPTGQNVLTGS